MFLHYDQAGLNAQYNLRERHPEQQQHYDRWNQDSAGIREKLDCRLDIPYGNSPLEKVDLFLPGKPDAPVVVYIHGGFWMSRDKESYSFMAAPLVAEGFAVVIINYDLVPQVSLDEIVRQCRASVAWSWQNARDFQGDPERIYVAGHSAGGHLTLMTLATDWSQWPGIPADVIKGGLAISGIYDLEPIRLCYQNAVMNLDQHAVESLSPLRLSYPARPPLTLAVGNEETEEFIRHTEEMAQSWKAGGGGTEHLVLEGHNHFTILDEMGTQAGALVQSLSRMAKRQ